MSKPYVWVHKLVAQDRTGHMESVRGALYNSTFDVIVSADEAGTVCVWNIADGSREGRFTKAHADAKAGPYWGGGRWGQQAFALYLQPTFHEWCPAPAGAPPGSCQLQPRPGAFHS